MPSPELLPILKRLNAAVGYLNLGMPQDAWNELEDIAAKDRARPEVLKVSVEVCRALKQWEMMAEVSNHLGAHATKARRLDCASASRRVVSVAPASPLRQRAKVPRKRSSGASLPSSASSSGYFASRIQVPAS